MSTTQYMTTCVQQFSFQQVKVRFLSIKRNIKKACDCKRIEDYENSLKDEMPLGLLASIMEPVLCY